MTTEISIPSASQRFIVTCYNVGTNGAVEANDAVKITTGSSNLIPQCVLAGSTAGTQTLAGGVALEAIATGAYGPVCVLGPVQCTANSAVTVKGWVALTYGTAGVRGRISPLASGTAATVASSKYLGYALTAAASGATCLIFVNPSPVNHA